MGLYSYGSLQTCDALLKSCEVLFYGEKTDFLAKCTSQPPVLKQKSTSQVAGSTSQVDESTSQVARSTITGRWNYLTGRKNGRKKSIAWISHQMMMQDLDLTHEGCRARITSARCSSCSCTFAAKDSRCLETDLKGLPACRGGLEDRILRPRFGCKVGSFSWRSSCRGPTTWRSCPIHG